MLVIIPSVFGLKFVYGSNTNNIGNDQLQCSNLSPIQQCERRVIFLRNYLSISTVRRVIHSIWLPWNFRFAHKSLGQAFLWSKTVRKTLKFDMDSVCHNYWTFQLLSQCGKSFDLYFSNASIGNEELPCNNMFPIQQECLSCERLVNPFKKLPVHFDGIESDPSSLDPWEFLRLLPSSQSKRFSWSDTVQKTLAFNMDSVYRNYWTFEHTTKLGKMKLLSIIRHVENLSSIVKFGTKTSYLLFWPSYWVGLWKFEFKNVLFGIPKSVIFLAIQGTWLPEKLSPWLTSVRWKLIHSIQIGLQLT